jgi:hypothetical protein
MALGNGRNMAHRHNCVPLRIWWRTRWCCIYCDWHFAVDVTGWQSASRGSVAFQNDVVSAFPREHGKDLKRKFWW